MEHYNLLIGDVITICGTFSFAVSGAFAAMQKRLDAFGVLIVAFVTAVGGGTLRDWLLGSTPVFWLKEINYSLVIIVTVILAMVFWKKIKTLKITLFLFLRAFGVDDTAVKVVSVAVVFLIRIVAVKYKLSLPRVY